MAEEQRTVRNSVTVTLNKSRRHLKNAKITGPVSISKFTDDGHIKIEIHGIEIDGFGQNSCDNLDKHHPQ